MRRVLLVGVSTTLGATRVHSGALWVDAALKTDQAGAPLQLSLGELDSAIQDTLQAIEAYGALLPEGERRQ